MLIEFFILLGSFLDLTLTYHFLKIYKERFPKKDYLAVETNPLVRTLCRSRGLGDGITMSGLIIFSILIALFFFLSENFKYFLAGVYYMMVTFHLTNFLALKNLKGGQKTNGKENRKR